MAVALAVPMAVVAVVAVGAAAASVMASKEATDFAAALVAVTEAKGAMAAAVPWVAPVPQ